MDFKKMIEEWVENKLSDPEVKKEVVDKWNESVKPYRDFYQTLLNYELQNDTKYTTQKTK